VRVQGLVEDATLRMIRFQLSGMLTNFCRSVQRENATQSLEDAIKKYQPRR
jgi:hypothetical protein